MAQILKFGLVCVVQYVDVTRAQNLAIQNSLVSITVLFCPTLSYGKVEESYVLLNFATC